MVSCDGGVQWSWWTLVMVVSGDGSQWWWLSVVVMVSGDAVVSDKFWFGSFDQNWQTFNNDTCQVLSASRLTSSLDLFQVVWFVVRGKMEVISLLSYNRLDWWGRTVLL